MKDFELLNDIKNQIASFDNKASILLTVNGFILAFTTGFASLLDSYKGLESPPIDFRYYFIVILLVTYFVSLLISGTLFVSVIFPRKRYLKVAASNSYYMDISKCEYEDYKKIGVEDANIYGQIWMNSKICATKHRLIVIGSYVLGISAICFLLIILLIIF